MEGWAGQLQDKIGGGGGEGRGSERDGGRPAGRPRAALCADTIVRFSQVARLTEVEVGEADYYTRTMPDYARTHQAGTDTCQRQR